MVTFIYFIGKTLCTCTFEGENSATWYGMEFFIQRMELSKFVCFCAQKQKLKVKYNVFKDLINNPRIYEIEEL